MDKLPFELICHIASFLPIIYSFSLDNSISDIRAPRYVRPRLATLSRKWQLAIEALTFHRIHLVFPDDKVTEDLDMFGSIFLGLPSGGTSKANGTPDQGLVHRRRRHVLQKLELHIDVKADDGAASFVAATTQVVFDYLAFWPPLPRISLFVYVRGNVKQPWMWDLPCGGEPIQKPKNLPAPSCVRDFRYENGFAYHQIEMASMLPKIETLQWGFTFPNRFPRDIYPADHHCKMIDSLSAFQLGPSTRTLKIRFRDDPLRVVYDWNTIGGFNPPRYDLVFAALRCATGPAANLDKISFVGNIDPSFFWPSETPNAMLLLPDWASVWRFDPDFGSSRFRSERLSAWSAKLAQLTKQPEQPFWTTVRELDVKFKTTSPSGQMYFHIPPKPWYLAWSTEHRTGVWSSASTTADFHLPLAPCDATLGPLLAAFARAVAQMKSLRKASLMLQDTDYDLRRNCNFERRLPRTPGIDPPSLPYALVSFAIFFLAEGVADDLYSGLMGDEWVKAVEKQNCDGIPITWRPRVYFHTFGWSPDEKVMRLFREIGRVRDGQDAVIGFLPNPVDDPKNRGPYVMRPDDYDWDRSPFLP